MLFNKYELPYCDNADYNYYHYGRWDYRNISCKTMTEENIFSKGISQVITGYRRFLSMKITTI